MSPEEAITEAKACRLRQMLGTHKADCAWCSRLERIGAPSRQTQGRKITMQTETEFFPPILVDFTTENPERIRRLGPGADNFDARAFDALLVNAWGESPPESIEEARSLADAVHEGKRGDWVAQAAAARIKAIAELAAECAREAVGVANEADRAELSGANASDEAGNVYAMSKLLSGRPRKEHWSEFIRAYDAELSRLAESR